VRSVTGELTGISVTEAAMPIIRERRASLGPHPRCCSVLAEFRFRGLFQLTDVYCQFCSAFVMLEPAAYSSSTWVCAKRTMRSNAALASLSSVSHSIVQLGRPCNFLNVATSYTPPAWDRNALSLG